MSDVAGGRSVHSSRRRQYLVSWVFHDVGRDPGAFGFGRVSVHLDRLDATFGHGEQTQERLVGIAKYQQLTGEGRDDG
jgi:hypothetical protein